MKVLTLGYDNSARNKNSILAGRLQDYGRLVDLFVMVAPCFGCETNEIEKTDLSANIQVYTIQEKERSLAAKIRMLWRIKKLATKLINDNKIDVISAQDPSDLGLVAYLVSRATGAGFHVQEHGDVFSTHFWRQESIFNFSRYYLGKFIIKRADSIRVVSQRIKDYLIKNFRIDKEKITCVPIIEDIQDKSRLEDVDKLKKELGNKFIYLTIGRFVKQKNLFLLLRAFKKLAARKKDVLLVLVGEGPLEQDLKKLATRLGIADKVKFYGWTDDIYSYYRAASAYVLSSNYEGWGRVIIEAAYCGLPIIMTDVGCAGEVIKDSESGLIAKIGDEKSFVRAMERTLTDVTLKNKISKNARLAYDNLVYKNKEYRMELYKKSWEIAATQQTASRQP